VCGLSLQLIDCASALACDVQRCCSCSCRLWRCIIVMPLPLSAFLFAAFSSRLGYEEHIPGQTRDWNEELQTTRELPRKHLPERLIRERTIFKVHSDFVVAATRGAMSVIDGNIMAINPGEDTKLVSRFVRLLI